MIRAEPRDKRRTAAFQAKLLAWFATNGVVLPWREQQTAYRVLVSEVMLQQTQRARVVPKFLQFLETFPTLEALAAATPAAVIRAWAGLGYNRRALRLHGVARAAVAAGGLPADPVALQALPGVGPYTAGAVACFAFGARVAFVDTNVRRVLRRVLAGHDDPGTAASDLALAEAALPPGDAVSWNTALMDLGALYCRARAPLCRECPVSAICLARTSFLEPRALSLGTSTHAPPMPPARRVAEAAAACGAGVAAKPKIGRFMSSDRYLRGRIVQALRELPHDATLATAALAASATGHGLPLLPDDLARVSELAARLCTEGLIEAVSTGDEVAYRLPG